MRVRRDELLNALEMTRPGLAQKEIMEQSTCFLFAEGRIITFNDEISCRVKSPLGNEIEGAIQSAPVLALLDKLKEEVVDIEQSNGQLSIKGKGRMSAIRMEKDPINPAQNIEPPKKWAKLDRYFPEALKLAVKCASSDLSQFNLSCVHVTSEHVESCDNYQAFRFPVTTHLKSDVLMRAEAVKILADYEPVGISVGSSWVHFRNNQKTVLSVRLIRNKIPYPDLTDVLSVEGKECVFPKGLAEAAEKAKIFSSENPEDDQVLVRLKPGRMLLKGEGVLGWYQESRKIKYAGPEFAFMIPPKLLIELVQPECVVGKKHLKIETERFTYISVIGAK